jgi:hypothetical protein
MVITHRDGDLKLGITAFTHMHNQGFTAKSRISAITRNHFASKSVTAVVGNLRKKALLLLRQHGLRGDLGGDNRHGEQAQSCKP